MSSFKSTLALAASIIAPLACAQNISVEGKPVAFDSPPKMVNGILMVPVRTMYDAMGVDMRWRSDRSVIEGLRKGSKLEIWVGNSQAELNDKRKDMEQAPYVWQGRTYAPLKFLADSFGYTISMDGGNITLQEVKR